jgi:hypothetical protein
MVGNCPNTAGAVRRTDKPATLARNAFRLSLLDLK